ncbi:MAG: three-Cys-motif partner protein TcmP, partial [Candidatus Latescibacteria bacterium]|nr:three-Cys-motif partner protein TcmP [Candidatus Latescibacterota bacterium]
MRSANTGFGGPWTEEKLAILKKYLDAYTTALKNQPFRLIYIDAFAGIGKVELTSIDEGKKEFIEGSAKIAVDVDDKPFDEYIFVEKDQDRCIQLDLLREANQGKNIQIENEDANDFLQNLQKDWRRYRGVLFLDPFATEVAWTTIEKIASFEALDTWILFPTSAIARMLPKKREPDNISQKWVNRLNRIYGDDSWRDLYSISPQLSLFGDEEQQRPEGIDGLIEIWRCCMNHIWGIMVECYFLVSCFFLS